MSLRALAISALLTGSLTPASHAAVTALDPIPLWQDGAPGALGTDPAKDVPTITPYLPDPAVATGAAMVICPGGGYATLAGHEGQGYAVFLAERGITCFVLKYRLGTNDYHHPSMLQDAQRAIRTVRAGAEQWKIDAGRIGIMGSSAGGHLASTAMTHFDLGDPDAADPVERVSARPDLGVLCYPVISMGPLGHGGSRWFLLGEDQSADRIRLLSNELHVSPMTPPTFLWHTRDDNVVDVRNSIEFANALLTYKVPFDLHIYQTGPHGMGLGEGVGVYKPGETDPASLHPWTNDLLHWLRLQGF